MSEQSSPRISLPDPLRNIKKNKDFSSAPASPCLLPQQETTVDEFDDGPTAIVIKNIPFSLKKDDFYYLMNVNDIPAPYALNYHFDNGIFRGLAFANYKHGQETLEAINKLNRLELGGRRLRVELKKSVTSPGTRNTDQQRQSRNRQGYNGASDLYEQLKDFCSDPTRCLFTPQTRSGKERKDVHLMAERFGLLHQSVGVFPDRQVQVQKKTTDDSTIEAKRESSVIRRSIIQSSSSTRQDTIPCPIRQPRGPDLAKNFDARKDMEQLSLKDILIHHRMANIVL